MSLPAVIFVLMQSDAAADGGVSSVSQVIAGLRQHRPIILTDRDTPRVKEWRKSGIEVHIVPQSASAGLSRNPSQTLRSYARYDRFIGRLLKESGARIIHANDPAAFQLAMLPAKRSRGVKIALNIRDTIDPDRRPPSARYRLLFAAADHVFYLSRNMAERWLDVAPNAMRACSVTYSIVDPDRFRAAPLPADTEEKIVLISGLIRPKKGQLDFIRNVAPALASEGVSTWFSGDFDPTRDAYMAACAEAAAPLGDRVRFLGYRTDVPELMRRATVVAIPSRYEGLVRAMIEAMATGRPIVSFDISSAREILEQESGGAGRVFALGDFEGMSTAILDYCRNRAHAADAAAKGVATARRLFDPAEVVPRYERVYRDLAR